MILKKGTYNLLTLSVIVGIIDIIVGVINILVTRNVIKLTLKDRQQKSDRTCQD